MASASEKDLIVALLRRKGSGAADAKRYENDLGGNPNMYGGAQIRQLRLKSILLF